MANGYFSMTIVGNLGRDPEMRYTPAGTPVTNFNAAVNVRMKEGQDWTEQTVWFRVTAWGNQAEVTNQYLRKGSKVLVDVDRLNFDPQTGGPKIFTRQDGSASASYEVTARRVHFLSGISNGETESTFDDEEESIPFS